MINTKKIVFSLIAMGLLLGATPAFGQFVGMWLGDGSGSCSPAPGIVIYPWQDWRGSISESEDIFKGEWRDKAGNHGTFYGKPTLSSSQERCFEGEWTWYDPFAPSSKPVVGGKFLITFNRFKECKGTWKTHWISSSSVGNIKGYKLN